MTKITKLVPKGTETIPRIHLSGHPSKAACMDEPFEYMANRLRSEDPITPETWAAVEKEFNRMKTQLIWLEQQKAKELK
jgi:hypothetical protein